jgi:hypothetical protein
MVLTPGLQADDEAGGELKLRAFYFNGDRDNRQDRESLALGGIARFTTASYNGFRASAAFYTSHDLLKRSGAPVLRHSNGSWVVDTSDIAGNSELVQADGSSIDTLGEATISWTVGKNTLTFGRQRLDTPMVNDYYNRFLPNSFEALRFTSNAIDDVKITVAMVQRWKYKAEEAFKDIGEGIGSDEPLYLAGIEYSLTSSARFDLYGYRLNDAFSTLHTKFGAKELMRFGEGWKVDGAVQYLKQDDEGAAIIGALDTYLLGAKVTLRDSRFSWTVMADQIGDDTVRGSGTDYATLGWSKFVNFTDIQIDGEALNAGAFSYGTSVAYRFTPAFSAALKYVHIEQDDARQLASTTPNKRPSSDEWNIDMKYAYAKNGQLRIRLAQIDYETNPVITNEYNEVNVRLIWDHSFAVSQ